MCSVVLLAHDTVCDAPASAGEDDTDVITVCTVVQHCCKGDSPCQWKTPIFTLPGIKKTQPIDIKLDRGDYVGDLSPHAHFVIPTLKGGGAAYA